MAKYSIFLLFWSLNSFAQIFIPFSNWGCSEIDFTHATGNEFAVGTLSNVSVSGNTLVLSAGQTSGTYTSLPFDKGRCRTTPFSPIASFGWETDLPYGKEIANTSELTTDYGSLASSTLMASIAHIWHLNGTGALASGDVVTAATGTNARAYHGNGAGFTYTSTAQLNSAVTFDGTDDRLEVLGYTQTNITKLTIAMWVRTNGTGNRVFMQNRGSGPGRSLTLGMGNNPGGCTGTNGRVSFGLDSDTIYIGRCMSAGAINDNQWHHIVATFDGTAGVAVAPAQFNIYIDGALAAMSNTTIGSLNAPLTGLGNVMMGRHEAWNVWYGGQMDEVAVWNRVLSATEAAQLYRRGGNKLLFQIRSCISATCSDNPTWMGPDGSSATFFSELNNNTLPITGAGTVKTALPLMTLSDFISLILPNSQYLQYKVDFRSNSTANSPVLERVTISY